VVVPSVLASLPRSSSNTSFSVRGERNFALNRD
jgi:hypothetical protein